MTESPTLKVSAPGKIILFGEHSVVYGKTAVAASLGLRTELETTSNDDGIVSVNLPDIGVQHSWEASVLASLEVPLLAGTTASSFSHQTPELLDVDAYIPQLQSFVRKTTADLDESKTNALVAFLLLHCGILRGLGSTEGGATFRVTSQLATGAGAGSSASYGVCLAAGILLQQRLRGSRSEHPADAALLSESDRATVLRWALISDRVMHGNPSGVDATVACRGGAVAFRRAAAQGDAPHVEEAECTGLTALLVYTNVPRNTKTKVAEVAALRARFGAVVNPVMDAMDALALEAQALLAELSRNSTAYERVFTDLEKLVSMNQSLLSTLGVSHPSIDAICAKTRRHGLAAKLTGAGGGGYVFALIPRDFPREAVDALITELADAGFSDATVVELGGEGLAAELVP